MFFFAVPIAINTQAQRCKSNLSGNCLLLQIKFLPNCQSVDVGMSNLRGVVLAVFD